MTLSSEADHALGKVTAHVLTNGNAYNLMTRDLTLNNSDKEKATTIEAYTYAVIQQIDQVLMFDRPSGDSKQN